MSLISDALKTAQRERASQAKVAKGGPQAGDGFFPYVSSAPARSRGKRAPIFIASGAAVVILGVAAWLLLPSFSSTPPVTRPPIILPPPVTMTQTPATTDTAAVGTALPTGSEVAASDAATAATANDPAPAARPSAERARVQPRERQVGAVSAAPDSSTRTTESVSRAPAPQGVARGVRVDYEAEAAALFNAGDLAGARDRFQLATRFAPTARAWTNYGVTLQRLGDFAGAASAYQSAIGVDANYLEAWLYQGRLAADQGDVARAVPLFQRALAIDPRSADVNVELARLEYESRNYAEAKRFAEDAARSDPANTRANWYIGVASDELKDPASAIRGYSAYLQHIGAAERDQAQFVGWARQRLATLRGKP